MFLGWTCGRRALHAAGGHAGGLTKKAEAYSGDIRTALREKNVRHSGISRDGQTIDIKVADEATQNTVRNIIADQFADLQVVSQPDGDGCACAPASPEAARKVQSKPSSRTSSRSTTGSTNWA